MPRSRRKGDRRFPLAFRPDRGYIARAFARLAQLDRALASGAKGHRFESCIARQRSPRDDSGFPDRSGASPFRRSGVGGPCQDLGLDFRIEFRAPTPRRNSASCSEPRSRALPSATRPGISASSFRGRRKARILGRAPRSLEGSGLRRPVSGSPLPPIGAPTGSLTRRTLPRRSGRRRSRGRRHSDRRPSARATRTDTRRPRTGTGRKRRTR